MLSVKPRYIVALAILAGLAATYSFHQYVTQRERGFSQAELSSRNVVVATTDLSLGAILTSGDLQVKAWPENIIPAGNFGDVQSLEGRVLRTEVNQGEAILSSKLAPEGSTGGVSSLIPTGMRAVTVGVDVVSGVGGFILPGTKVDVLVTVSTSNKLEDKHTKMILQNVEVLAVDQTYDKHEGEPREVKSVTLLVGPEDAEKLALGATEGKLRLSLRNSADSDLQATTGQQLSKLLASPKPKRVAPKKVTRTRRPAPKPKKQVAKAPKVVEVIRANEKTEVEFDNDKE